MDGSSRRRFLRTAVAGSLALPSLIHAQIRPGVDPSPDTTDPALPASPEEEVPTPAERRRRRRRGEEAPASELPLIKPRALTEGSTIAVVAPASGVPRGEELDAAATLRNLGFKVKLGEHLGRGYGYLAARDNQRAQEVMRFIEDPEVDCVMAIRGGYGVMRILPLLDFKKIRANPKVVIGFSDITALINPIYSLSRMIAFHGPMATSSFDSYTLDSFRRTLMSPSAAGTFSESDEFQGESFGDAHASTIVKGRASGRLVGGNLSLVTAMMGTPYDIPMKGHILFLEEVHEEPYKVDRMLTQLAISGKLASCAGVALGRFTKCEAPRSAGEFKLSLSLEEVIRGILEPLGIPTIYGLSIGHIRSKLTIPIGGMATLDTEAKTITIDEPVVVAAM